MIKYRLISRKPLGKLSGLQCASAQSCIPTDHLGSGEPLGRPEPSQEKLYVGPLLYISSPHDRVSCTVNQRQLVTYFTLLVSHYYP